MIYSQALRKVVADDVREQKLAGLRNSFQNLFRAENIVRSDLNWGLLDVISPADRDFVETQFAKRHVITHNLGLVDERFRAQIQTWQQAGQDIEIIYEDIARLLVLIESTLQAAITMLEGIENSL